MSGRRALASPASLSLPLRWKGLVAMTLGACAAYALGTAVAAHWDRLRHLAVPVLVEASATAGPGALALQESAACKLESLTRIEGRVGALLESEGALWIGGFDTGIYRWAKQGPTAEPVLGLEGRERFVNALTAHAGRVFAATYGGLLEIGREGQVRARHLAGTACEALLESDGTLYVGTAQGLFRSEESGFVEVPVKDAAAVPLRITSLAASGRRLWMGTGSGVWDLPLARAAAGSGAELRWHPLVFGEQPARTNTVLALAPFDDGVFAGTDNGGLVEVDSAGTTRAFAFREPRANEVNPGAAASGARAAFFGTQGGGLLFASKAKGFRVSRPRGWPLCVVSAVAGTEDRLLVGTGDGQVWLVACP